MTAPEFCLTADLDWTSEFAVQGFLDLAAEFGIRPTVFATHRSAALDAALARGAAEVAAHPNFLSGSTHGHDIGSVVDHVSALYPDARAFRAHAFRDDTHVTDAMVARGYTHDSNICLFLEHALAPIRHHSGLLRFPVFWEDDVHYRGAHEWSVDRWLPDFLSPGLKVLNVHPFMLATNVPTTAHYRAIKAHIPTLGPGDLAGARFDGEGVATFLRDLLCALATRKVRFATLGELYAKAAPRRPAIVAGVVHGRQALHSQEEADRYPSMTDAEKQDFVRREFEGRNPTDPYATSRDYNMRELEIQAIGKELVEPGPVLDLGCGNGHTLISLARPRPGWRFTGVDFSTNLIDGARTLASQQGEAMIGGLEFVHADAIAHLQGLASGSVRYVITERFLQNLPSRSSQLATLGDIHRVLAPGGRLLMCEGSEDGFEQLNDLRAAVGLPRIPSTSRENVSALRFHDREIDPALREIGFTVEKKVGFSLYFIIARVLHPLLVAPDSPRFDAPINDLAGLVQAHTQAAPGYGGSMLWVCQK